MTEPREPGSPVLLIADTGQLERFAGADALAARVHRLRGAAGLDVTVGHASTGGPIFPGVLIWRSVPTAHAASDRVASASDRVASASDRVASASEQRTYLAFAAGSDVDTPTRLLAALSRTRAAVAL